MLTINSLAAADEVIIPVQAHYLPLKGLEQLVSTVTKVQKLSGSPELPRGVRFLGTESRKGGVRAGSRGMGCCPLMGTVLFYKLRRTMKMGGGDGCRTM